MYAKIVNGVPQVGSPPNPYWNGSDWVPWADGMGGWYYVIPVTKPADTATQIYESQLIAQNNIPVMVWVARDKTPEELTDYNARQNEQQIKDALNTALADLQTLIDTLNATINSNPANAIKIVARAERRIIRILLRQFDATT